MQVQTLPDRIELGPEEEAARLWSGAREAFARAGESLWALCEALKLGIRAAELRAHLRLRAAREQFPATIGAQLEEPAAEVEVERDALRPPRSLEFIDVLDLFSEPDLDCVAPHLHRGWEDRRFACERSRTTARRAAGVGLDREQRDRLLLLAAYHNRIFRRPPPVRVATRDVLLAFPELVRLVEDLGR